MNIDWVIACRYAEVHDNLGTMVGAGIDTFWLRELPGPVQVMLAVRLLAMDEELGSDQQHVLVNRVRDPRGDTIGEARMEFAVEAQSARPEWLAGMLLTHVVRFEATEEGTYTVEYAVDAAEKSLPIHVVHGLPPGVELPEE